MSYKTAEQVQADYASGTSQVSSGEKTAGTETALRTFSPKDVADMAGTHGGGGGGSVSASMSHVFQATLSSATQDTNANTDFTWDSSVKTSDISHTNGDSEIVLATAGEYMVYYEVIVTNATANNRTTWYLHLDWLNSSDVSQYEFSAGSTYIRDDAANYNSGGRAGVARIFATANDKIIIRSKEGDSEDPTDDNPADQTLSRVRIELITYS